MMGAGLHPRLPFKFRKRGRWMRKWMIILLVAAVVSTVFLPGLSRGDDRTDRVTYRKDYRDPVLKRMKEEMDSLAAVRDSITAEINKRYREKEKKEREEREEIRLDFKEIRKPESPESFSPPFHFKPVPQYYTGTCWCFCTTSFMESEIARLTGTEIKLSEMYTVYWEYVEKARGYIRKRGNQPFAQGGESDGVFIIWDKYGVVPLEEYPGLTGSNDKHNHKMLRNEMFGYLECVRENGTWDEEHNLAQIRLILDRYLGRPPAEFEFEGRKITPKEFVDKVLKVDTDDYVQVMSTLSEPFYVQAEFDVPDNWRPTDTYYNLPLDEFYGHIRKAVSEGYTVCIGGDVSEPGYNGFEDGAVIPDYDIPRDYISQDSREMRIYNHTTTDDHGIHLLAHREVDGDDWFLIKDSSRSSRHGEFHGYLFYREDYVKLKMLTYTVHRDVLEDLEPKFRKAAREME
ncbi:MAG: peptidase C1 [Candidatus Latescibacteria bacterium]|nr:peptidase C1 [bacterium]MBD3424494.1 peptidase C1 [Candidatus Latescibacterota bacterium]